MSGLRLQRASMTECSTPALQLRLPQTGLRLVEVVSQWNDLSW
jgi:hypothetical protein